MYKIKFRNNIFTATVAALAAIGIALLCIIVRVSFSHYVNNVKMYHSVAISDFEDMRKKLAVVALQLIEEDEIIHVLKNNNITPQEELSARNLAGKYRNLHNINQIIIVNNENKVFTNFNMLGEDAEQYENKYFDFKNLYREYKENGRHYLTIKDYDGDYRQFFVYEDYKKFIVIFVLSEEIVSGLFKTERDNADFDTCISYNNEPFAFSGDVEIFEDNILRYDKLSNKDYSIFGDRLLIADSSGNMSSVSLIKITDVLMNLFKDIIWILIVIFALFECVVLFLRKYSRKFKSLQVKHYQDISQMKKHAMMENQSMAFLKIFYGIKLSPSEHEALEHYLSPESEAVYRFILIKYEDINKISNIQENEAELFEIVQSRLQKSGRIKIVKLNEGVAGIILSDKHDCDDEKIRFQLQNCYIDIWNIIKIKVNIFISGKYYGMNDFIEKAPVLLKMQDITFFNKENYIMFDNAYERFKDIIPYPIQTEQKALEALANGEKEIYIEQIDRFAGRIKQTTPFAAKCYLSILATNMVNYTKITNNAVSEDIISMVEICEDLDKAVELIKDVAVDVKLATDERDEKFCDNIVEFIEKNYNNYDFCVSDLAEYLGVSTSYAGKKFRNKFGQSFNTYLSELRIEKASELLVSSDMKIGKIGEMCGFRTDAYFVTIFKKIKKMSPQEFRKQNSVK